MSTPAQARPRGSSGPSRHVYDVGVVGGQLAGAVAACLLAKRGYHVLYVEHDGMGPGYQHDGWLLPYAPFVMPAPKAMGALEAVATELGLLTPLQRTVLPCEGGLQLLSPGARFEVSADPAQLARELARVLDPAEASAFTAALQQRLACATAAEPFLKEAAEFPPDGMMGRFRFNRLTGRYPALEAPRPAAAGPLMALLDGLLPFLAHLDGAATGFATRPLGLALQGPHAVHGGHEALREQFLHRLRELGGDVLVHDESTVVEALAFEGGQLTGLKLVRGDMVYRTSAVIAATDAGALRRLVPDKKKNRAVVEALDAASLKRFVFTVNWVLPERALPRGLGALALWDTGDSELSPVLLQVSAARKAAAPNPQEHERVVCAAMVVPATARELGEDHLKSLAARLSEKLEALLPFARAQVLVESAPYLDASGVRGSRLLPHPLVGFEESPLLGVGGLHPRAPAKHLFLCNREVLPGLGLEGELLAAQRVANLVQETLPKNDPLKRR